jgi:hypothetical protein
MQIGIITFHFALSYGAALQAYALSECIKSLGHDVYLVDYRPDYLVKRYQWNWTRCGLHLTNLTHPLLHKRFGEFSSKHLRLSSRSYKTLEELTASPPEADAYICGSDQIWNPEITGMDPAYFLCFAPQGTRRIAYAASFGKKELTQTERHRIAPYLKDFDHLSVREASAVRIVNDACGKQAEHVLDPTLIIDNYDSIETHNPVKNSYVLVVILQNNSLLRQAADFVSRALQLPKVVVTYSGRIWQLSGKRVFPGPGGYLGLFRNADYVVTNSFHGTAFSLVFNKPFIITSLSGNLSEKNIRITEFLRSIELSNFFMDMFSESSIRKILASAIDLDWAPVRMRLHKLRQDSLRFLQESLS